MVYACHQQHYGQPKKAMEELVTETKSQNDKLDDIAEGLTYREYVYEIVKVY